MSDASSPSAGWDVILATYARAKELIARWVAEGLLISAQEQEIVAGLEQRLSELEALARQQAEIPNMPEMLPLQADELPAIRALRLWFFMSHEIVTMKDRGLLTLSQSHAIEVECRERISSLKRRLQQEGVKIVPPSRRESISPASASHEKPASQPIETDASPPRDAVSDARSHSDDRASKQSDWPSSFSLDRRNLLEILLDPRSIQWLMGLGGALMVVGIVILLWINEYFTPPVLATVIGLVNVAVLGAGWGTILKTRYQLVGKGLTLLACLVMPLNLWYYHTHDLVTIDGHLWVVAVIISALYAASALVLKDEMFVYVFNIGVVMTGLLIIADMPPSPQKFWEIASPATLLVVLGLIGIHTERSFPDDDNPFNRRRFGRAFFISGHALLIVGLSMVFIAQLAGDWLYEAWFKSVYQALNALPSPICGELRWLSLVLVLSGLYACIYSDVVVKMHGTFIHLAGALLLWAEVLIVQLLHLELGVDAIIVVLAMTSLVVNVVHSRFLSEQQLTRAIPIFGLFLGILPVLMGLSEYFRYLGFREVWVGREPRWSYVFAMALTMVSSRIGAYLYRHTSLWLSTAYFFAAAAAAMVGAVAALAAFGLNTWEEHAPIMMLMPIAFLVASRLYREKSPAVPLRWVAHTATVVMLVSSLSSALSGFTHIVEGQMLNLALAAFFLEATIFYALATVFEQRPVCVHWSTIMACGAVWQIMTYFGFETETYLLAFALIGLVLLLLYRFSIIEQTIAAPLAEAAFTSANTLLSLAFVSAFFRGLTRLQSSSFSGTNDVDLWFLGFCLIMALIALVATFIVQVPSWRRWFVINAIGQGAHALMTIHQLIDLNMWQQLELFSVLIGLLLLSIGHLGWYREQERESDVVSMSLFFGSLLAVVPLAIATWYDRGQGHFLIINEAGFLFVGVLLLGSGVILQLKSTTIVGTFATALYFITLMIFIPWSRLNAIAILIIIGGGTLFGTGLILAFFRDRLLTVPHRIKNREGVFKVLNWR